MKILIIEDEILIQKSLKKLFELRGCFVETEEIGQMAITKIQNQSFDRILCDLMLKDINGFDIIEESKNKYSPVEISKKFIIMTAYSSPEILNRAQRYKCPIISKPFEDINETLDFAMNTSGKHNVYNALGAIAVAKKLGYSWEELKKSLLNFQGVSRRLELLYDNEKIKIYDDYAHHPTEIEAVINSQVGKSKKLIVIFQPHRYTRTQEKWNGFSSCFLRADKTFILPLYSANEPEIEGINSENLVKSINERGGEADFLPEIKNIKEIITASHDTVILALGAGSISRQMRILVREL